jgi:tRNA (cmo5U34)-methyltransferase
LLALVYKSAYSPFWRVYAKNPSLLEIWLRLLRYAEMPAEEVEKFRDAYGRDVAVLPPHEVESMIAGSGFSQPVLFFQTLLIHAWYTRVDR